MLGLALVFIAATSGDPSAWPASPPDCWGQPRLVHRVEPWRPVSQFVSVTNRDVRIFEDVDSSPNGAYWFRISNEQGAVSLTYYAEKDHVVEVAFADVRWLGDVTWVNEKLIFARVWLGRIAAHDLMFDVESEQVIFSRSVLDGRLAYEQFKQGCKTLGGCGCAEPDPSSIPES